MKLDFSTLNENQLTAVNWNEGPLLVLAGPGSGKTRVLTMRVARLILESPNENFKVLGLTFTKKAADEMRIRLEELLGVGQKRAFLATFHAFCTELLRQHGSHIGLKPDFSVIGQDADREAAFTESVRNLKKNKILDDDDTDYLTYFPQIDRFLSNSVQDEEVQNWVSRDDLKVSLAEIFKEYKATLIRENKVDFPSIIYFVDRLLREKPRIAKQVRIIYSYICIDEYQDTNLAQYRILKLLAGDQSPNLFVVADDDQIIYQWNGASPERLESLRKDYQMTVVQLPANYRCPPDVINLANNLITNNLNRSADKKPLVAMKKISVEDKSNIRLKSLSDFDKEIEWITADIKQRSQDDRNNTVILARTTKLIQSVADSLNAANIPAYIVVRKNDFESVPVQWLFSVLKLTNTRADREQLRRICKSFFKIEGLDIRVEDIVSESTLWGGDFMRTWFEVVLKSENLESETEAFLKDVKKPLLEKMDFNLFIEKSFKWLDLIEKKFSNVKAEVFADFGDEKKIWDELQDQIFRAHGRDETTLHVFLQEFDLAPKTKQPPTGAVQCLTIHSSKGMEFRHVYLIGLAEDMLPSFQSIKSGADSREMQEERRNCFVAITRAQETLTLTYANKYNGWAKKPSRFLTEMGLLDS